MKKVLMIALAGLFGFVGICNAVVITAVEDAEVRSDEPDNPSYGEQSYMSAGYGTDMPNARKGYIKFDASVLADNMLVTNIGSFLMDFNTTYARQGHFFLLVGEGVDGWDETTITWNNAPANDLVNVTDFLNDGTNTSIYIGLNAAATGTNEFEWGSQTAMDAVINELNTGDRIATLAFRRSGDRWVQFATHESINGAPMQMTLETAQTWPLAVAADAEVRQDDPNNPIYGHQSYISALYVSGPPARKGYLKFDASSLDRLGYTITVTNIASFLLDFNVQYARQGDFYLLIGGSADSWEETTITWNNAPANDLVNVTEFLSDVTYTSIYIGQNAMAAGTNEFEWASQAAEDAVINELNTGDRVATLAFRRNGDRFVQFTTREHTTRMPMRMAFEVAYEAKLYEGTPVPWILQYWDDTNDYAASGNDDLDSMTNYEEYLADTLPKDSNSVLRVESVSNDNGIAVVTWRNGGTNANVTLESRDDLAIGSWTNVYTLSAPESTINSYGHTNAASSSFYRVEARRP